jgi:threonine aldolase
VTDTDDSLNLSDDDAEALRQRRQSLRATSLHLQGHGPESQAAELERVAAYIREHDLAKDHYGTGRVIEDFEAEVAALLGMESASFMPSGCMAQPIALRIWAERAQNFNTAFHATSHLELHEEHGYRELHGLQAHLLGDPARPTLAADLEGLPPLSSLLVELPAREIGGQLPSWEQLLELVEAARAGGARVHLDGARLWEAQVAYGRPFPELCALFDSVYVSFYKGIGALPGAMLLGPADFIQEANLWRRRQGGTLYSVLPNLVSAKMRLAAQVERMPRFRERALEVAPHWSGLASVTVLPDPPQVNMFHLLFEGEPEALELARDAVAEEHGVWLFGGLRATEQGARTEIGIGNAALELPLEKLAQALRRFGEALG